MAVRIIPDIPSLKALVGTEIGVSDWIEITQERIDLFAKATGDCQWIHTDPDRAKRESPFGTTIAHGHLTASLAPHLLSQIMEVRGARLLVNPGIEKMRFRSPVPVGSRLRMRATLKALRELPGGAQRAIFGMRFEVEGEKRPAAFGNALLVYYP
ncbi:MAG: MaoC family dehydratase [Deltaproteobacteria bacterium]|nr:MaoC family dehydratase [Deltaproteobacteria bacterium]MBW2393264.1 MaoC family dehydratase [Deltaproteobacteria bacterium]